MSYKLYGPMYIRISVILNRNTSNSLNAFAKGFSYYDMSSDSDLKMINKVYRFGNGVLFLLQRLCKYFFLNTFNFS